MSLPCLNKVTSYPILSYPILSYAILSYPTLSYPILSYPILSYLILSCPVLSCSVLSYHILSYPIHSYPYFVVVSAIPAIEFAIPCAFPKCIPVYLFRLFTTYLLLGTIKPHKVANDDTQSYCKPLSYFLVVSV